LIAVSLSEKRDCKGGAYWLCQCDCGNQKEISGSNLTSGKSQSCGCFAKELSAERAKRLFTKEKQICSVDDCNDDTRKGGLGLCGKHAQRLRRYGDVSFVTSAEQTRINNRQSQLARIKTVKTTTYRKLFGRHEHRVIAEKIAGRKLQTNEHVHHIDGNRHNNNPVNLQILTAEEHARLHAAEKSK
jgi:hypothetical protein